MVWTHDALRHIPPQKNPSEGQNTQLASLTRLKRIDSESLESQNAKNTI